MCSIVVEQLTHYPKLEPSLTEGDNAKKYFGASSSSIGETPSDLHSYSKRRFIRPFAPPCYPWLSLLLGLAGGSKGEGGGEVESLEKAVRS